MRALITGGGSGIGLALARSLVDYDVLITGRDESKLKATGLPYRVCDLSLYEEVEELFEGLELDLLIHSAAYFHEEKSASELTRSDLEKVVDENLRPFLNLLPFLGQVKDTGRIVFISSRAGILEDILPKRAMYSGAKSFVTGAARSIGQDLKAKVITICPGLVSDTGMGRKHLLSHPEAKGMTASELANVIARLILLESPHHTYRIDQNQIEEIN